MDAPRRAKVIAIIKVLEETGPTLPFPYSSQVAGKLRELRTHYGEEHYRILYYGAIDRAFVLLHALVKRTSKIATADVKLAQERMRRSDVHKRNRRGR